MKTISTLGVLVPALFISVLGQGNGTGRKFPTYFKFGAATAAYQIEGGWNVDGKGESIWDHFVHVRPEMIKDGNTGDITCNSYNFYKRDIGILKELGVDFYRLSLSWPRILPTGFSNRVNKAGVNYYMTLFKELRENGIEPVVTLYHWDLPQPLQDLGGWTNPLIADYFEDYARVVFNIFGGVVSNWLTFNEPGEVCLAGYGDDVNAPALNFKGIAEYLCAHTLLKAHARVYHLYDTKFRPEQKGRVSLTLSGRFHVAGSDSSANISAADRANQFEIGWYAHPIFSKDGDYPRVMKEAIAQRSQEQGYARSRLPVFTPEEVEYIQGSYDFFGINHYTTRMVKTLTSDPGYPNPSLADDLRVDAYAEDFWETAESDWLKVVPWGFRKLLNWIKDSFDNPEIVVFENGFSDKGELNDLKRINYYKEYLNALLDAIDDGCTITGYTVWTLMDNFEWREGFTERFGLYHVDFNSPNRTRTPKASAKYYSDLIKTREIM